ncbi:hypothetical protein QMA69_05415 [Burkholderia pseudomallei]|uniref:hypothetical protein n=1 Tax=Burkholderia pseudomallei TaxID=28450 RepID=UPI002DBA01AB|nr:hypothetical protein [Burkholderia pseudomallei]MEB5483932.1 hypothetical protein [Burkholderia pseudomallei]MEB5490813.1 hypothetical protein [Burkholderia pseudomallei]MEB5497483.1 hypothetical protein [Burkholderia pseudomallei]MEB5502787.1 hypothetical protein [Burkholderia pseudomallei]MEB5510167.1 hypothetical protein [Burkholderia pseudomallei]
MSKTLTAAARATIMDACQSISRSADALKAGCSIDGEWPDADDKAFYDAELRLLERLTALLAAPQPSTQADARGEDAYVAKRLSEALADVYTTLIGDDKVDADDKLNAIERVERAAQVLRVEVELYRAQASAPVGLTDSARDVLAERRRQIEREGWTPARDDQYRDHELSCAAGCYAMYTLAYPAGDPPPAWPWAADWWKPTTHRRNLVKAGALILAEIERIDRDAARTQGS